jgi:hypothetical protein
LFRLRDSNAELLAALEEAREWIMYCQANGCPAGPIAVPSKINDAIAKAKGN